MNSVSEWLQITVKAQLPTQTVRHQQNANFPGRFRAWPEIHWCKNSFPFSTRGWVLSHSSGKTLPVAAKHLQVFSLNFSLDTQPPAAGSGNGCSLPGKGQPWANLLCVACAERGAGAAGGCCGTRRLFDLVDTVKQRHGTNNNTWHFYSPSCSKHFISVNQLPLQPSLWKRVCLNFTGG